MLVIALAAIGGLLLVMSRLATSEATVATPEISPQASPTTSPEDEVVATVNGQKITQQTWNKAARLDAVMNQLTSQPLPTAEETLDRLVNEIIVLEAITATSKPPSPGAAEIEARVLALEQNWRVTEADVGAALEKVSLTRDDLNERVGRLIQVEAGLNQLAAQQNDLNAWLAQARASAEIGLYRPLVDSAPVEPTANQPAQVSSSQDESGTGQAKIFAPPPEMPVAAYPDQAAPDFTLKLLNGEPLTLSSFRGKPTLVNFWASWCPPCRQELPALQAAYTRYGDQIGFIAVDVKEDPATVESFIKELNLTFPIALDPDGQVSDFSYEARGIPTSIFVDAYGVVAARHVGPLDEAAIDGYLAPLLETEERRERAEGIGEQAEERAATLLTRDTVASLSTGDYTVPNNNQPAAPSLTAALTLAHDFTLTSAAGTPVSLADYRGKSSVVLAFYRGQT